MFAGNMANVLDSTTACARFVARGSNRSSNLLLLGTWQEFFTLEQHDLWEGMEYVLLSSSV